MNDQVSFEADIKPLFREGDRSSMLSVSIVTRGRQPERRRDSRPAERWHDAVRRRMAEEQVDLFQRWTEGGKPG